MYSNVDPLRTMSVSMMPVASAGGRMYVPVNPSQFGYAQFQYVAGYPAPSGQSGISIDKVKILDTLINQLVSMKQKNVDTNVTKRGIMSDSQIDGLIKQYQQQIQTVTATAQNMPYIPNLPQTGAIFNLVA